MKKNNKTKGNAGETQRRLSTIAGNHLGILFEGHSAPGLVKRERAGSCATTTRTFSLGEWKWRIRVSGFE